MDKFLNFRVRKSEYIRLNQIVNDLARISDLEEIHELDSIVTNIVNRHYFDGLDEYFNRKIRF